MGHWTEKEYKQAKEIKRGKREISEDFIPLMNWVNRHYDVNVINFTIGPKIRNKKINIGIMLEFEKDDDKFSYRPGHSIFEENERIGKMKIEIAQKIIEICSKKFFDMFHLKEKHNIGVDDFNFYFDSFETMAKEEVIERISDKKLDKILKSIDSPYLWKIYADYSNVVFFTYTEEQKDEIQGSEFSIKLNKIFFDLVKGRDEFDYWKFEDFNTQFDSKENFESVYEGNWFFYSRRG